MITQETRADALRHAIMLFRASGPCTRSDVKRELLIQTTNVTSFNADEVTDGVMWSLLSEHVIEPYDAEGAYDLTTFFHERAV